MLSSLGKSAGIDESVPLILPMLRCFDPDVLVGAAVLKYRFWGGCTLTGGQEQELSELLMQARTHPDPLVRAVSVILSSANWCGGPLVIFDETRY